MQPKPETRAEEARAGEQRAGDERAGDERAAVSPADATRDQARDQASRDAATKAADAATTKATNGGSPVVFERGKIEGVVVRDLRKFVDDRGWLAELFRHDELEEEFYPTMAYTSVTLAGVQRGPHEHVEQADLFCFIGPSNFKLRMWDNRESSPTYRRVMTLFVGEDSPRSVLVPAGVAHAYRNVGPVPGVVINCPNRLYMGQSRRAEVDEIRHEDDPATIFRMDE